VQSFRALSGCGGAPYSHIRVGTDAWYAFSCAVSRRTKYRAPTSYMQQCCVLRPNATNANARGTCTVALHCTEAGVGWPIRSGLRGTVRSTDSLGVLRQSSGKILDPRSLPRRKTVCRAKVVTPKVPSGLQLSQIPLTQIPLSQIPLSQIPLWPRPCQYTVYCIPPWVLGTEETGCGFEATHMSYVPLVQPGHMAHAAPLPFAPVYSVTLSVLVTAH
jgi:hypothetical protein